MNDVDAWKALLGLLKRLEWKETKESRVSHDGGKGYTTSFVTRTECMACGNEKSKGHAKSCELDAAIRGIDTMFFLFREAQRIE